MSTQLKRIAVARDIRAPLQNSTVSTNLSLPNLLDFDEDSLREFLVDRGEKSFHATQLLAWMHQHGVTDFDRMTNLSQSLRQKLRLTTLIQTPHIALEQSSVDGTQKWLLRLADGNAVETVFIPEVGRGTLCVSSQVGCALNCRFCSTGKQGFNRNLTVAEIIGQVWVAVRRLAVMNTDSMPSCKVTNIVMMGMGEPLLNFDSVVKAMALMMSDYGYGLSKRRVTLSTSGLVPEMERLAKVSDVSLAVSLHAARNELRTRLVPINGKYPLEMLMDTCRHYFQGQPRRKVMMEYVMLEGINDTEQHAKELIGCLQGVPAKVNLIPFNPFPDTEYTCSTPETIERFFAIVKKSGIVVTVRKTRGGDIDGACGQLVGQVADRTRRHRLWQDRIIL